MTRPNLGDIAAHLVDRRIGVQFDGDDITRVPGELMVMFNKLWNPNPAEVSVIQCNGWHRGMTWEQTELNFVPPSPGMPHLSTVRQYPGACLIEATNLSEGRGTPLPFEVVGAPYLDETRLAAHLNALGMAGVIYRPHVFKPTSSKFNREVCKGVQAHIVSTEYRPLLAWMQVIRAVRDLYPNDFTWRTEAFARLYGSESGRAFVESDRPLDELAEAWDADGRAFREQRKPYLIYADGSSGIR
jgi:uncharacterized protein YbbC (DUF1343 family)